MLCLNEGFSTFDEEARAGHRFDFYFDRSGIVEIPDEPASDEQADRTENSPTATATTDRRTPQ
jgi:hypothetical protein